jgi:hypothetical protein
MDMVEKMMSSMFVITCHVNIYGFRYQVQGRVFQVKCFVCCKRLANHFVSVRSLGFIYKAGRKPVLWWVICCAP